MVGYDDVVGLSQRLFSQIKYLVAQQHAPTALKSAFLDPIKERMGIEVALELFARSDQDFMGMFTGSVGGRVRGGGGGRVELGGQVSQVVRRGGDGGRRGHGVNRWGCSNLSPLSTKLWAPSSIRVPLMPDQPQLSKGGR